MGIVFKNLYIFWGYTYNIAFWFISKIESNDLLLESHGILIENRLNIKKKVAAYLFTDIDNVVIVNYRYTRHPYQGIIINLKNGNIKKYSFSGFKDNEMQQIFDLIRSKNLTVSIKETPW
jgi:hypothetical protein